MKQWKRNSYFASNIGAKVRKKLNWVNTIREIRMNSP